MNNIIFIDAPSGAGKTKYINRIMEGCKKKGLKTLFVSDRDMHDLIIMEAQLKMQNIKDSPLTRVALENDVVAVDDIDVSFKGKPSMEKILAGFAIFMASNGKTVIFSGIKLKRRVPFICAATWDVSLWLHKEQIQ